jgi:hypothetical protein
MSQQRITIVWADAPVRATIEVLHGRLATINTNGDNTEVHSDGSIHSGGGAIRWTLTIADSCNNAGVKGTRVRVLAEHRSFTFFTRDISRENPVLLIPYGAAVTTADDLRSYAEIADGIRARGLSTELDKIRLACEEDFAQASTEVRNPHCPVWLGLSRDMRMFEVDNFTDRGYWGFIRPKLPKEGICLPETGALPVEYGFVVGRGTSCQLNISRYLEEGCLPIIHSDAHDGGIDYHLTAFADLEHTPFTSSNLRGTHYLVADRKSFGFSHSDEQARHAEELEPQEYDEQDEQTLLCMRIVAQNNGDVPAFAWFEAPNPEHVQTSQAILRDYYVNSPGLGCFTPDRVFCAARVNGRPLGQAEIAILIQPKQCVVVEYYLPHRPIDAIRGMRLLSSDAASFEERHKRCRTFWRETLAKAAVVQIPEQRIDEMFRAGLLHLDLITYGNEPAGTLAPNVGRYAPIGTESSPIIQMYDTVGRHDLARRSIQYFLDKQRDNGQMQNYMHYQSETGPVLWAIGEHYRYTRDIEWVRSIAAKLNKACDYLIDRRKENLRESLRGRGYGLIDGAVADPEETTHYFMNSGYVYLGLARVAEMFEPIDPQRSSELAAVANGLKNDLLTAVQEAIARGPVIPLEDGTWVPTVGPFVESEGALALLTERTIALTHSNFHLHDSALGPLYLMLQELIDPCSPTGDLLLKAHHRLATTRNVSPSQPYYCRHDYAHLRRGEVNAFLKCYYNTVASQADRETYTFWEHQYGYGVHKTHEETWFLMQTRWMLMVEVGPDLHLLSGIPRRWMNGESPFQFKGLVSHFGPVDLTVHSRPDQGLIEARIRGGTRPLPKRVSIRLPHPAGQRAVECVGGHYDDNKERVLLDTFNGEAVIKLRFA